MAGMLDFFKSAPTRQATVGTGGLRDLYMAHIEQAASQGAPALPFPEFVKMLQQQEQMRQQQMQQQMPQGGMLTRP